MTAWVMAMGLGVVSVIIGALLQRFILWPLWRWQAHRAEMAEWDGEENAPSRDWRWVGVVLTIALLGVSVGAFQIGLAERDKTAERENFPTTTGMIVRSEAVPNVLDTEMSLVGDVVETQYNVYIEYTYRVEDTDYRGERIVFDERLSGEARLFEQAVAEDLIAKYPLNQPITVIYDPANPRRAGLELPANSAASGIGFIAGAVLGMIGGAAGLPLLMTKPRN